VCPEEKKILTPALGVCDAKKKGKKKEKRDISNSFRIPMENKRQRW
jgi:hypothetical protein